MAGGPSTNTGKITQSQLKVQSFFFDCSDPTVAFTDGVYTTDVVLKNNAFVYYTAIKYMQSLAAFPSGIVITVFQTSTAINPIFQQTTTPLSNTPNVYTRGSLVPGAGNVAANPTISSCINNNNCGVVVELQNLTGQTTVTALSFMFVIMYVELDF